MEIGASLIDIYFATIKISKEMPRWKLKLITRSKYNWIRRN